MNMNLSELINEILSEWAYRVDDGQPNPKNEKHLAQLSIVLSEMGLSDIKAELFENITEADKNFTNPILNKEIPYKGADGTQKKGIVGNLLRLPKDSEGRKAAEKLMPPEGSPERDSAMQDLGSEKDGKSTGGDKEKGKEDEKGKEGEKEKGAGEEEKAKAAAAMFDPKADPAMGARMDREKAANDKLAQKDKEDSEAEKAPTPGSPEDFKNKADKVAKDKEEAKKNGYDDSLHAMSDNQLDNAKYEAEQKMHAAQKSGDDKMFDKARMEYQQHKIEKEMRGAKSAGDRQIANSMSVDFQKRKAAYEEKYGEPYEADIPYPDSDGGERTSAKWGGEEPTGPEAGPNAEPPANEPSKPDTTPPVDAEEPKDGEELPAPAALGDKPKETKVDKATKEIDKLLDKAESDANDIEALKKYAAENPELFANTGLDWDKMDPAVLNQIKNRKETREKIKQNAQKAKTKEQPSEPAKREPANDDPESKAQKFKGNKSGEEIQTMEIEGGGFVYGTKHGNTAMVDDILDDVKSKIPKERWKDIVFVGEGGATNDETGEIDFNDEMDYAAPKFKELGAGVDTWDGDDMDVHKSDSKLYQKQKEKTGLKDNQILAGNWASMVGQGEGEGLDPNDPEHTMKGKDYLDDEGKQFLQDAAKEAGLPPIEDFDNPTGEKPSEENGWKGTGDRGTLYRLSFPGDNGDKETKINDIQVAFNDARDEHLIEKNKELTSKGKIPITIAGESHVDLVDKMTRKSSDTKPEQPSAEKPEQPSAEKPEQPTDTKPEDKPEDKPKEEPAKPTETPKATKDDIKKEKPGKEAKTDSGGSLYSVGGGYYSDKPNGPAKYVRTESVIEMAFDDSLNEDVFALFEKSITGTLQNGEKITVQELPPRAVKKATQRAKAAAATSKEEPTQAPTSTEKPVDEPKGWDKYDAPKGADDKSSWDGMKTGWDGYEKPKGVDDKSTWDKTPIPKGETPPPGTKKAGGTPPPPPPPLPTKKTDGTDVPGKFTPIKNPPPANEKGVEKDGKIAGTTIETEPSLQNINPEFLKQKSTEMNKYYDEFKQDKKKAEGIAREKMGYSEEQVKGLKGEEKSAYDKEVKKNQQPTYNLCKVSLPNSNLFCSGNKGIPRAKMPQFTGEPVEGSQAWDVLQKAKETDPNETEANGQPYFRQMLADKGIKVTDASVPSESLKATQTELVGDKVLGMKSVLDAGPSHPAYKKMTAPLYVSNDGYVVDGHHRWAAITAYNMEHPDNPLPLKTMIIDQPIDDAIETSNTFANEFGVAAKSGKQTGADAQKSEPEQPSSAKKGLSRQAKEAVVNIKNKTKDWADENKSFFKEKVHKGNSPERRSWGQAIKDKGLGAWEAIKKGAKHEVEEFKAAGMGAKNFFSGKPVSEHEKKALKAVGIKIAVTALTGAAFGGMAHGAAAFAKHVAIEFIPHTVAELIAGGVGKAALFAGDEEQDMDKMMEKFAGMIAEKMATADMDPEMMETMVDSFNEKQNPKTEMKIESLIREIIYEIKLEEASTQSGDWKLAARKGGPEGKIVYFGSKEKKQAAISSGSHVDVDKNLNAKQGDTTNTKTDEPIAGASMYDTDYKDSRVDTPEKPTGKKKKEKQFPKGYIAPTVTPSQVKEGLDNGDLTALTECNDNLLHNRDIGVSGMGGPVASYGEAGLCRTANTLREKGYEGFVDDNIEAVNAKMMQIKEKKPRFQKAINTVANQLGYVLPKDEEKIIEYLGARMVFGEQEFQRLSSNPDSIWTKEGKQGFGEDRDAFDAWAKAIFDGALSTKSLIENQSDIDTTKPYVVIQSNTVEGEGHDEGILNHLKDRLEKAKQSGNEEDIQYYSIEIDAFEKLGFHDTMVVGQDKKGRTNVFHITNKKQDDLADIWGNTTPAYMLNIIKKQFDPKVAIKVVKVIDAGIADVSDAKMATNREFANFKLDTNFIKVLETPELKKYVTALTTEKKFNAWLKEKMGKKYPPKNLQLYVAGAQQYVQSQIDAGENPSYEKFGKLLTKVGELGQNTKYIRKYADTIKFNSSGIQAAVENKNSEKELTAKVHKNVVRAIDSADKALKTWPGKEKGINGPHKQAYVTTVIHSMHLDLMITNYDKKLGAITGIRGTTPADFRDCMSELSGFKSNPKKSEAENRAALNKHLVERCTLDPVSHAILIKNGKGTVTLAEDTWRTAGTSQKVEKKLGDGLRGCVASKADARRKSNRQAGK